MKTIGLIGGISWVSTVDYYKYINEGINKKLGGLHFSRCIIHSFSYSDIKKNNDANDWDATLKMFAEATENMKAGGAKAIVLCANTMHMIADQLEEKTGLPVIHIATETAKVIRKKNLKKVGLLGTKFTMERDFFKEKLAAQQIETIIPDDADREFIHTSIFEELGKGILNEHTKKRYLQIIQKLTEQGAQGIVLGCTEIPLLIQPNDVSLPTFDTTYIHSMAAVDFALT
jgi:aspartate racemase